MSTHRRTLGAATPSQPKRTVQRDAIRRAFTEEPRPLSPGSVLLYARTYAPSLGPATVYRTLAQFVDEGFLVTVDLPGGATLYERAGKHHHHHFHCRSCDRVYDVDGCSTRIEKLVPKGFQVEAHELTLKGVCAACA